MQLPDFADHYWLEKLKSEFYFSVEEAKYLKDQMDGNYEAVYIFCDADIFEQFDKIFIYSVFPNYSSDIESIEANLKECTPNKYMNLMQHYNRAQNLFFNNLHDKPLPLAQDETHLLQR